MGNLCEKRKIFPSLLGNEKLKSAFASDLSRGKTAHAYILDGSAGSGKHTAAGLICASAVCEHRGDENYPLPCGECRTCRRILSGISVDVLTVSNGDKATIGVDLIREVRNSLYISPNDGDMKFYVIENAHLMTQQAQNALLLSLEEPPPYVMFLLLSEDSSALLETVKSRAPIIRMEKFSPDFVEEHLYSEHKKADPEKVKYAAHLSDGSLGTADKIFLHGDADLKLYKTAEELARVLVSPKRSEALTFLSSMPKDRQSVCRVLSLSKLALRDAVAAKKGGPLLFYSKAEGVPDYTKKISVRRLIELAGLLSDAERDIAANCSQNTVLPSLIMNSQKG